ncbi:MAG TPA: sigma-70 family RNA polymerase sigma factor [Anaerolineaceae bacterium]|nr:sigma-70 family RNA polymerase sigma factor [Anaerolineaceae bacterium]
MIQPELLAARAGYEPDAFGSLYDRYYTRVYNYLRYRLDDDASAEELCAQVFERLLGHIRRYDPERGPFEPWLFAIARNALRDHWRRMKLRRFLPLDTLNRKASAAVSPEEQAVRDEEIESLKRALSALDGRERDLLGLKFAAGLTNREIAQMTGLTESNVGVILYRAVQKLKKITTGEGRPIDTAAPARIEVDHERA